MGRCQVTPPDACLMPKICRAGLVLRKPTALSLIFMECYDNSSIGVFHLSHPEQSQRVTRQLIQQLSGGCTQQHSINEDSKPSSST